MLVRLISIVSLEFSVSPEFSCPRNSRVPGILGEIAAVPGIAVSPELPLSPEFP